MKRGASSSSSCGSSSSVKSPLRRRHRVEMDGDNDRIVERAAGVMLKRRRVREIGYDRENMRDNYLFKLIYECDVACVDMLHVTRNIFFDLCSLLRARGLARDTIYVKVEEQVAMFLHTVAHEDKNRVLRINFFRSEEAVSRYFNHILYAIWELGKEYVRLPSHETPNVISSNSKFMPFFKDCVGALDGTHIRARVSNSIVSRFRGRKPYPTQNVLAAVGFDMKFQYVLAGWEGSAHDATVLKNALEREHGLKVPEGKYYLVDAGYATCPGFISPYHRVRYHLNEFSSTNPPSTEKELFNHRHSSLRTTVERAFGMLKNRFSLLDSEPHHPYTTQVDIVIVCCILHNFIIERGGDTYNDTSSPTPPRSEQFSHAHSSQQQREDTDEWLAIRDSIAKEMWEVHTKADN